VKIFLIKLTHGVIEKDLNLKEKDLFKKLHVENLLNDENGNLY